MGYLDLALEVANHESTKSEGRGNIEMVKTAFPGAIELTGLDALKVEYSETLGRFRELQSRADDNSQPLEDREPLLPELETLSRRLGELLFEIGQSEKYTEAERDQGFLI